MAFKAFSRVKSKTTKKRAKVEKAPTVTILKQGNFSFNTGAVKLLGKTPPGKILLMFDKDAKSIGFKPARKSKKEAYTLRVVKGIGQVSGNAFLRSYGIPFGESSKKYPAKWNEELGLLVIKL